MVYLGYRKQEEERKKFRRILRRVTRCGFEVNWLKTLPKATIAKLPKFERFERPNKTWKHRRDHIRHCIEEELSYW
jgi:ferritin